MNRKERRKLERAGMRPKEEPTLMVKPSALTKKVVTEEPGKELMEREIHNQCLKSERELMINMDTVLLWTLYNLYGWGPKRLKDLYVAMFKEHQRMREFYEMEDLYPERQKLKERGIDIEAWYNELFDEENNLRSEGDRG